jgi:hypothetical protein
MSDPQSKRLIFTPDLLRLLKPEREHSSPLLHRLALIEGPEGEAIREQIERAARVVPESKRQRVLGPIRGKKSSDDQVQDALGTLLLAKTLEDLGWQVEHEPEEAGGTPDLRIRKADAVYLVEVRSVAGPLRDAFSTDISRLRDALRGIKSTTPITIRCARLGGQSSLKPFVRHLKDLLTAPKSDKVHVFTQNDVYVEFRIHEKLEYEVDVLHGWIGMTSHGQGLDDIRAAIHEKLERYKVPIIVALDLRNLPWSFRAVEEVALGQVTVSVPLEPDEGDAIESLRVSRANDSLFAAPGSDGARARTRLQALLPFRLHSADSRLYAVHARVIANPALDPSNQLDEFDPIPRLIVTEEREEGRLMNYMVGGTRVPDTSELADWRHIP